MEFQSEKDAWDYIKRRQDELCQQFEQLSDEEMSRAIDEIMQVYEKYKSARIAEVCAGILRSFIARQSLESAKERVTRLSELYTTHRDNDTVLGEYARSLVILTFKQDLTDRQETVLRLSELYASHSGNDMVLELYAQALVNLTDESDLAIWQESVSRLEKLYANHSDKNTVVEVYAQALLFLLCEQNLIDCQKSVARLRELYNDHSETAIVQAVYADALTNLMGRQNSTEVQETAMIVEFLYNENKNKPNQEFPAFLIAYGDSLIRLACEENRIKKDNSETLSKLSSILFNEDNTRILEYSISEMFKSLVTSTNDILFSRKVIEIIVNSYSEANSIKELWKYYASKMKLDSSSCSTVTSKDDLINRILLVHSVKIIMDTLMMRDLSKVDINHYTSLNNVKFLLQKPNPNKDKDDKAALRLYNATYMNDPEEGKALISYFKAGDEQKLKWLDEEEEEESSSVYLCSLTMEEDMLPLWTQYGNDGKGACIGFKDDFFDTSTRVTEQTIKMLLNDEKKIKRPKESKKLPLYCVCYVDNAENLTCKGLGEDKLDIIKNHLKNIRDIITNEKNKETQGFFREVVDEIRYLFKDKGYSHEREVRLLENVPMSSDRLKLDNRPDLVAPKLYIDYETPILIRKIIFGPKAEGTEVLKPYIKYCDPKIDIEHSKIKYR
ncbi:DUF2971 domain-containing protein [Aerococcaceae bacterium NML201209]|nr:DUF2971 domain-containing protein [Aerococcaceae bacterium NML201209]